MWSKRWSTRATVLGGFVAVARWIPCTIPCTLDIRCAVSPVAGLSMVSIPTGTILRTISLIGSMPTSFDDILRHATRKWLRVSFLAPARTSCLSKFDSMHWNNYFPIMGGCIKSMAKGWDWSLRYGVVWQNYSSAVIPLSIRVKVFCRPCRYQA